MADLLISYSREDQTFVRQLHCALSDHGLDVWVDWEGIPVTAAWLQEIFGAIEAADTIIFVISPASVVSEICRLEIEHAVSHHKRIVPIICRPTDIKSVPEEVRRLNWLVFEPANFKDGLGRLREAIETDLDWVRAHTRLLVRAREWENRRRESSLLLRGRDLQSAETWLAMAGEEKEPQPTELQWEYVRASRQAETSRNRLLSVTAVVSLTIVTLVSLFAWAQRNRAFDEQQFADSRRLAATSLAMIDRQLDAALLLSVEAYATSSTVESKTSLFRALTASPELVAFLPNGSKPIETVAFSPDGKLLVSGSQDGVQIWDVTLHQIVGKFGASGGAVQPHSLVFSPDGKLLASASSAGATLFDVSQREPMGLPLRGNLLPINTVAFSPDGRTLAMGGGNLGAFDSRGEIIFWDIATRNMVGPPIGSVPHAITSLAFSPDGKVLASGVNDGSGERTLMLWDTATRQLLGQPLGNKRSAQTVSVAFSPDGKVLASGSRRHGPASDGGEIQFWDVATRGAIGPPRTSQTIEVSSLAFSSDGSYLLSNGGLGDRDVLVWFTQFGDSPRTLKGHPAIVRAVAVSPDGRALASGDVAGNLILWDVTQHFPLSRPLKLGDTLYGEAEQDGDNFVVLSFGADDKSLIGVDAQGRTTTWDISTGQVRGTTASAKGDTPPKPRDKDERAGLVVRSGEKIGLWDGDTGKELGSFEARAGYVAISSDGKLLVSYGFPSHGWMPHPPFLWDVDIEGWRHRVCAIVNRNMTRTEWEQHLPQQPYRKTCTEFSEGQ